MADSAMKLIRLGAREDAIRLLRECFAIFIIEAKAIGGQTLLREMNGLPEKVNAVLTSTAGRGTTRAYTYDFQVTRNNAVRITDVVRNDELNARYEWAEEVYDDEFEPDKGVADATESGWPEQRGGGNNLSSSPQAGARAQNDRVAEGEPRRDADGSTAEVERDRRPGVKFSANPDTGFEEGSVADSAMKLIRLGAREDAIRLLRECFTIFNKVEKRSKREIASALRCVGVKSGKK